MSRLSFISGDTGNAGDKVMTLPAAGTTQLAAETHANKLILVGFATSAVTIKLPQAVGSMDAYKVLNTIARTSGSLIFQLVNTASVFNVMIESLDSTAVATDTSSWFSTNATQITLNITTTGGLGGDYLEFVDGAAGTWYVFGRTRCSGDKVTPLA